MGKIVIEVHSKEIEIDGFDFLWDKIRTVYKTEKYKVFNVEKDKENTLFYIELVPLKEKELENLL